MSNFDERLKRGASSSALAQQFLCQYRALLLFFPDGDECQFRCDERPDEGRRLRLRGSCLGRWQDGRFAAHLCHWRPALPQHYLPLLSLIRRELF